MQGRPGTATITATTVDGGYTAVCKVTFSGVSLPVPVTGISLSETELFVDRDSTFLLTATVSPSNASDRRVRWQSSDTAVAVVDTAGKVTMQGRPGTATITATTVDGGYTAVCKVTFSGVSLPVPVTGISLSETELFVDRDSTFLLTATVSPSNASDRRVRWQSSDTAVAVVDTAGKVTMQGRPGTATITATTVDGGYTAVCKVTFSGVSLPVPVTGISLSETELFVDRDSTFLLTATVSPSNASDRRVRWQSSDTAVAVVDTAGKVTMQGRPGTATITATTVDGGYTAVCKVTFSGVSLPVPVTGISLSETELFVDRDSTFLLTATVSPSNASDRRVRWQSSDTAVAVVDTAGKVTMQGRPGTATITATTVDGGYTAVCKVTFSGVSLPVPVTGISLSETELFVDRDSTFLLTATVYPLNASDRRVRWQSSDTAVAAVDTAGKVTMQGRPGTATITTTTVNGGYTAACAVIARYAAAVLSDPVCGRVEVRNNGKNQAELQAFPNYGYHFDRWTTPEGNSLSADNPFAFVLTRDTIIQAHFAKNIYHVTSFAENGRTETADGKSDYAYQDTVHVKAVADYGYHDFVKWTTLSGDSLSADNPFAFVLTRDTTIQAHFAKNSYQVSLSAGKNGKIKSGEGEYAYNTQAEVRAEADENYHLAKWVNAAGDSLSDVNPYRFVVKGDTVLTAVFAKDRHLVTIDATEGGQAFGKGFYSYGTLVAMEAVPDSGYVFTGWMAGDSFDIKISERSKFSFTLTEKAFTSYRAAFLAKDLTGFETLLGVNGEARAYYADGVLHLVNLEGYFISISTITGEKVLQFMADGDNEQRAAALPAGVYILNAAKWKERYVVRKFVVKE
ncbi:hypothetical protein Barb6XT_01796 [Bacteroidales bacterium Barb6XT]|nr:hypothetical protein Barb6XT_01796 [Bacteroidales bacterium Barb6XT]